MDGSLFPLLLLALLLLAFWFLVVGPARKRQRAQEAVVSALEPGQKVLLASGMVARIHAVGDGDVEVEIAPGVVVTVVNQAVIRRLDEAAEDVQPPAGTGDAAATDPPA